MLCNGHVEIRLRTGSSSLNLAYTDALQDQRLKTGHCQHIVGRTFDRRDIDAVYTDRSDLQSPLSQRGLGPTMRPTLPTNR